MKVWIDQELCTGAGTCASIAPAVFALADDGLAYVKDGSRVLPAGPEGLGAVPDPMVDDTIEAAESCPAECIYLQAD